MTEIGKGDDASLIIIFNSVHDNVQDHGGITILTLIQLICLAFKRLN